MGRVERWSGHFRAREDHLMSTNCRSDLLELKTTLSFWEVGRDTKYFKVRISDVSYTFEKTEGGNCVTEQAPLRRVGTGLYRVQRVSTVPPVHLS